MAHLSKEDKQLLQQALQDVVPLKAGEKAHVVHPRTAPIQYPAIIGRDDKTSASGKIIFHDNDEVHPEHIFFTRVGVQHRVAQQLRLGKIRPQATFDLHGYTVDEARSAVAEFLMRARSAQWRAIKIIHGKGSGILRSKVYQWLPQSPQVLAVASTIASDGGTGAVYVLLGRNT